VFLNADVIAARLRQEGHQAEGLDIAAGRAVLAEMRRLVGVGGSFCVETNLASRGLVQTVHSWQTKGYRVWLYFVALRSPELAIARVAARVAGGGQYVADEVVRRRWKAGLKALFEVYIDAVDQWSLVDNSERVAVPVARGGRGALEIEDAARWAELRRLAVDGR
jgi:predicted ABC-type ATPase